MYLFLLKLLAFAFRQQTTVNVSNSIINLQSNAQLFACQAINKNNFSLMINSTALKSSFGVDTSSTTQVQKFLISSQMINSPNITYNNLITNNFPTTTASAYNIQVQPNSSQYLNFIPGQYSFQTQVQFGTQIFTTNNSYSVQPISMQAYNQQLFFDKNQPGSNEVLNLHFQNPCAIVPKETIVEFIISSNTLQTLNNQSLYPFFNIPSACQIIVNGKQVQAQCQIANSSLVISNLFQTEITTNNISIQVPNVVVPFQINSINVNFYYQTVKQQNIFLNFQIYNFKLDMPNMFMDNAGLIQKASPTQQCSLQFTMYSQYQSQYNGDYMLSFNDPFFIQPQSMTYTVTDIQTQKSVTATIQTNGRQVMLSNIRFPRNLSSGVKISIAFNNVQVQNVLVQSSFDLSFYQNGVNLFGGASQNIGYQFNITENNNWSVQMSSYQPCAISSVNIGVSNQYMTDDNTLQIDLQSLLSIQSSDLKNVQIFPQGSYNISLTNGNVLTVQNIQQSNIRIVLNQVQNNCQQIIAQQLSLKVLSSNGSVIYSDIKTINLQAGFIQIYQYNKIDANTLQIQFNHSAINTLHYLVLQFSSSLTNVSSISLTNASFPFVGQSFSLISGSNNYFADSLLLYSAANNINSMTIQCSGCGSLQPLLQAVFYNQQNLNSIKTSNIML